MKKWISIILVMVLAFACLAVPAFADEVDPVETSPVTPTPAVKEVSVTIPVTITLSGTLPRTDEDYTVKVEPGDPAYPMPEGTEDGVYTMTVTGADTVSFTITYYRVGVYTYTIYQVAGDNSKCTYDDTVYTLVVTITNTEDFSGFEATAVLYPDDSDVKQNEAEFENKYKTDRPNNPTPTPKPTPKPEPEVEVVVTPEPSYEPEPEVTPAPETTPEPTPEATPEPGDPNTPKTGDESQPMLYAALMLVSLGVIVTLFLTRKGKSNQE